jgi:hypothetical protein
MPGAKFSQSFGSKAHEVLPVKPHPARKLRLLRQQLQDGARQHGLAATGFADNAERPSGADRQIDAIHRTEIAARRRQVNRHSLDRKQRCPRHNAP